jgi:NAD(P)H-hydrate epimerase
MKYMAKMEIKLPRRKKESKKGDNGRVLIIGGSRDYVGAVALAGLAALRSGADWVTIAAPEKVGYAINALSPDLVVKKYKGDDFCASRAKDILKFEKGFDAVLIGNGIGMHASSFVKKYVKETKKPLVIDADGIKNSSIDIVKNSIITPHKKELEIFLLNSKIKKEIIKKIINEKIPAKKAQLIKNNLKKFLEKKNVILLKGPTDIIISKNKISLNKTGNAGMSKAGTGDVLAGLCAGFLAQNKDPFQSAANAAYFNGLIGDILLKKKKGFTYLASDMVSEIKRLSSL